MGVLGRLRKEAGKGFQAMIGKGLARGLLDAGGTKRAWSEKHRDFTAYGRGRDGMKN